MEYQYYINAYGFLILGFFLIVFNLPVLVVVCTFKTLRHQYGVLIISLLNGVLTGLVSFGYGTFRLVLFSAGRDDETITVRQCFHNPLTFFLLWTFPMTGLGLLVNSIDRLIVITLPLTYFHYNSRIVSSLVIIALVINSAIVFAACYITLRTRSASLMVNIFCNQMEIYSKEMFVTLVSIRTVFTFLAVLLMFVVLVLFVKHNRIRAKQAFHTDEAIKRFKARQMDYTRTMLISCVATILVFIIPSTFAIVSRLLDMSAHVATWTRFVSFINSFNIAILLIHRQKDIRSKLFSMLNYVFSKSLVDIATVDFTNAEIYRVPEGRGPERAFVIMELAKDYQFYMNTFGYITLGVCLTIVNVPVLAVVSLSRGLRKQYGVLIISLFNGIFSGFGTFGYGLFRLVVYTSQTDKKLVTLEQCLCNPLTFFLVWTFPMMGLGLLINSIDRFLAISVPLSYFRYNSNFVVALNIAALSVNCLFVFVVFFITIQNRSMALMVNIFCNHREIFSSEIFITLAASRSIFGLLAVLLMLAVLILFVRHQKKSKRTSQAFHTDQTMKRFKSRQMNYTKTMLISCAATIVLFVIPATYSIMGRVFGLDESGSMTAWTRFVCFFNSFNIAFLLIYRQKDIRCRLFKVVNFVCRTKEEEDHNSQTVIRDISPVIPV
ncbi:hypothetical protein QR680_013900 [Steinernema hermaphroditum]|uniref:G-protein coupled receptors family 1 profile domain-containing protein n=1 Tax=Steinernema hermaphroditum TaxID=289476 RepID=A0AA39I724_9BILA|nr:hypothetical protein QR680_013900 [Steinernema hermaphroditum]